MIGLRYLVVCAVGFKGVEEKRVPLPRLDLQPLKVVSFTVRIVRISAVLHSGRTKSFYCIK